MRAIYGADPYEGEILFKGKKLQPAPDKAIAAGIALVPEERRSQGLFTILTIRSNVPVMNMGKVSPGGFINDATERKITLEYVDKLKIATNTIEKEAAKLSGGNQQKVVRSKCLFADADLLMLDEPTRGIDVGAKSEIYNLIRQLSRKGRRSSSSLRSARSHEHLRQHLSSVRRESALDIAQQLRCGQRADPSRGHGRSIAMQINQVQKPSKPLNRGSLAG